MNGDYLHKLSIDFSIKLEAVKTSLSVPFEWYPYGTLGNFIHLQECFNMYPLDKLCPDSRVADIGGADGDLALFLHSLGFKVDSIDHAPTNYNYLKGQSALIKALNAEGKIRLFDIDIDERFKFPHDQYNLMFFLGILYHLQNPYYILTKLSTVSKHLIISTRVMQYGPNGTYVGDLSLAYLLAPDETNNDSTNYWIFSKPGLRRIVERCGWLIQYETSVGDLASSNPSDPQRDERVFMLLTSQR